MMSVLLLFLWAQKQSSIIAIFHPPTFPFPPYMNISIYSFHVKNVEFAQEQFSAVPPGDNVVYSHSIPLHSTAFPIQSYTILPLPIAV